MIICLCPLPQWQGLILYPNLLIVDNTTWWSSRRTFGLHLWALVQTLPRGYAGWRARSCYRTSGCPPWSATPRVSCTPSSWTGSRRRCEGPRPGPRGRTTSPGASGSTQSVTTCGCRHFDIENKYQPVKLTLFLVSFCRRGSKHLKGFSLCLVLKEGLGVWPYPGPYLVLSTPTSLSTEGRRGPVKWHVSYLILELILLLPFPS